MAGWVGVIDAPKTQSTTIAIVLIRAHIAFTKFLTQLLVH